MRRNEHTTVEKLQIGDRFHKYDDSGKGIYQVMDPEKQIRTKSQKHFICSVNFLGTRSQANKTIPVKPDLQVIFLRNINQKN